MPEQNLRHIKTKVHLLPSLGSINNNGENQTQAIKLYARGKLAGQFLFSKLSSNDDEVLFTGDFKGFFKDEQGYIYFEGCIENFIPEQINNETQNELIEQLKENTFHGYFKGTIQLQNRWINLGQNLCTVEYLKNQNLIIQKQKIEVLIPTFASFVVKNLNSIDFNTSSAKVSATLIIKMKLSQGIMRRLQKGKHSVLMGLGRQNSFELPFEREGQKKDQDCFITYSFDEKSKIMHYVIRKTFETSIDNTHGQFYAPFNLIYLKIVLSFYEIGLDLVYLEGSNKKDLSNQGKKLSLKFLCYDLNDTLEKNNPYSNYNDLQKLNDHFQKLSKKVTKIHASKHIQCGDYLVASNNLSLFPFYRDTIGNKTKQNTNAKWNLGIQNRNFYIVNPKVQSIVQQFKKRACKGASDDAQASKIFEFKHWNHVHIQIPIYRYWFIYFIQICLPLLILSTISMFVFLQENGLKSDGFSTFNQRIANGIALLLAYGAMIPVLKEHMAQSTFFSFFQLVIYLSIIPMVLALISSIIDSRLSYTDWKTSYKPFSNVYFVISFAYVCFLVLVVIIIVIVAIKISLFDRQVRFNFLTLKFCQFSDTQQPTSFKEYVNQIQKQRSCQYTINTVQDIDVQGNGIGLKRRQLTVERVSWNYQE